MARPLRIEYPHALYHITARGNARQHIYLSDHDRNQFLRVLTQIIDTHHWLCHAYCLMNNHYHLLIETPDANLSRGMRDLNSIYSQRFNRIHERDGHVFQGRFKAFVIEAETYFTEVARYIVLNPVRAHIVSHPKDWAWSSYLATAGLAPSHVALITQEILQRFDVKTNIARALYEQFVEAGIGKENPFHHVAHGIVLGYTEFADSVYDKKPDDQCLTEVPRTERLADRPSLQGLLPHFTNRRERNAMIEIAHLACGYSQSAIARHLGIHYSTVSKVIANSRFKT